MADNVANWVGDQHLWTMAQAKLNAQHIQAIHSAMVWGEGNYSKAAQCLRDNDWVGWDAEKLYQIVQDNSSLRARWGEPIDVTTVPKPPPKPTTDIYRPDSVEMDKTEEERLTVEALTHYEQEYRRHLADAGQEPDVIQSMVATGKLQSKFALATLQSLTGGLAVLCNRLIQAMEKTQKDLDELLAIEDPVKRSLLIEREKVLRQFFLGLDAAHSVKFRLFKDAFYMQLAATKRGKVPNGERPKRILGITAMPNQSVNDES